MGSESIIDSEALNPIIQADYLSHVGADEKAEVVDSGLSSIEKSKAIAALLVPMMGMPMLMPPASELSQNGINAISGQSATQAFNAFSSDMRSKVLNAWKENLREIEIIIKESLPKEFRKQTELTLNIRQDQQRRALENLPATDEQGVSILPLAATLLAGGALALSQLPAITSGISINPLDGLSSFVMKLEPVLPQILIADVIPAINLMIMAPLYMHAWQTAAKNFKAKGQQQFNLTAQNFAKEVIKMVSDPAFIYSMAVRQIGRLDQLTVEKKEQIASILKLILAVVALGLLYSVEVGKVQKGKFGGLEPQELRDILLGNTKLENKKGKLTVQEQLTKTLINLTHAQLSFLKMEDRVHITEAVLGYLNQTRDFNHMLDPAKIFREVLNSTHFSTHDQIDFLKA